MSAPNWACWHWNWRRGWRLLGRRAARKTAMNLVERPYLPGRAEVVNAGTGEKWERLKGSWFKTRDARARAGRRAA